MRKTLAARASDAKPLAKRGEFGKGRKRDDNGTSIRRGSNSSDYLLARIKRDRPDLISEIGEGRKYPSARSAAQAAGISVGNRQVYMPSDPSIAAKKLVSSFDAAYIDELVQELQELKTASKPPGGRSKKRDEPSTRYKQLSIQEFLEQKKDEI